MALASVSEAYTQLDANLLWEGDATKAQNFVEAGRYLLFHRAQIMSQSGSHLNFFAIQEELNKAQAFITRSTDTRRLIRTQVSYPS